MRSFKHPAFWVMCIALLSPVASDTAMAQNTVQIDSIVALVDDDVILRSELEIATRGIVDRIRQQGGDLPPQSLLEKQVLERLIIRRLQLLRAYQTGIRVSGVGPLHSTVHICRGRRVGGVIVWVSANVAH